MCNIHKDGKDLQRNDVEQLRGSTGKGRGGRRQLMFTQIITDGRTEEEILRKAFKKNYVIIWEF